MLNDHMATVATSMPTPLQLSSTSTLSATPRSASRRPRSTPITATAIATTQMANTPDAKRNADSSSKSPRPQSFRLELDDSAESDNDIPVPAWVDVILDSASEAPRNSNRSTARSLSDMHSSANPILSSLHNNIINPPSPPPKSNRLAFASTRSPARRPPSIHTLVAQAKLAKGLQRIRLALAVIRAPDAPSFNSIASDFDAPNSLITMLKHERFYTRPHDCAAVIVAAHALCNHRVFQAKFLASGGLTALCDLLSPALVDDDDDINNNINGGDGPSTNADRESSPSDVFSIRSTLPATERLTPPSGSNSTSLPVSPLEDDVSVDDDDDDDDIDARPGNLSTEFTAPGGIHRVVWDAAIRTIAKLMVVSHAACSKAIDTGSLALLAKAAKPEEPMDIRLRSAAGLAAIAAWSGPRRAVDIVQTDDVVLSMTSILAERDERIPNDLRTATIDGLVVMSFRRHARRILQKYECEDKIKAAARYATVSGDYTTAARSTVAAGHLIGKSIDEYGFMVVDQDDRQGLGHDGAESAPETVSDAAAESSSRLVRRPTGLEQIHQQLLEEPYIEVEDLNVLEEIVHEDAGVLSSSPRDRNYVRRAARTYGVSADEIEFISLLEEDAASPVRRDDEDQVHSPNTNQNTTKEMAGDIDNEITPQPGRVVSSVQGSANSVEGQTTAIRSTSQRAGSRTGATNSPNRVSGSSPRLSSQLFPMQDPDFDQALLNVDEDEPGSSATAASSKSKMTSPLLMFSFAARKAAEKDQNRAPMQKTTSQLSREMENEQKWKNVLEKRPDLLKRERGKSSRVLGYRELAGIPVPPSMRRKLWPLLLDTESLRRDKPRLYGILCAEGETKTLSDDIEHTIEADVTRTMPLHSYFWAGGAQLGVQSLRSMLRAYAFHVPEVGYCQGMSSIAALLLMNAVDEEEAFLMMVQFMSRFQYKKIFAPGFPLMLYWLDELKPLIRHYMPELSDHMEGEKVELNYFADKWLITALTHNFPHRHLLRVWDVMFLGGSPKIVLKACLMVLKCCEEQLMQMDFEGMARLLQRDFAEPDKGVLDLKDPEPFISEMREFRFMNDIKKATALNGTSTKIGSNHQKGNQLPGEEKSKRDKCLNILGCFKRSSTID